jgi:deazaflavin-dependent oxidoreductase (nitroreductase family)
MTVGRLRTKPTGWRRLFFRAPVHLYRWHLGFLLGRRLVLIEHVGRKSGQQRSTVLEVVMAQESTVYVAAGWGNSSDWLLNVTANPRITYQLGRDRFTGKAETIDRDEARSALSEYARQHPFVFARLARFMVEDPGNTPKELVERVIGVIPLVRLSAEQPSPSP